jgi:glycosyltransferase involved in cell wall biosynthesis
MRLSMNRSVQSELRSAHAEVAPGSPRDASDLGPSPLIDRGRGPLVLLFYHGYEMQANPGRFGRLKSDLRGHARAAWRRVRGKQVHTGFYTAFLGLVSALRRIGCEVRINDFALARQMPHYPIGIAGYPGVIGRVAGLTNPMLFGPGDPGHPGEAGRLAGRTGIHHIIQPSDWYVELYRQACGDAVVRWPVGIDVAALPDARSHAKDIDVVIYDKIRWHRDRMVPALRDRLIRELEGRGLSHVVLRYGHHTRDEYFDRLRRGRSLAFLCEHETQGLACEEAMAMNVPVFAWDEGELVDPIQRPMAPHGLWASSVPYFSETCGVRFTQATLEPCFDDFWSRLNEFRPRDYVADELGLEKSARDYLALLTATGR